MIETLRRYLRYTSWPIITAMIALMFMGVTAIRISELADESIRGSTVNQAKYACVALAAFVIVTAIPFKSLGRAAYPFFFVTLVLLVLVLFFRPINRAHRWIDLRIVRMQPSEIAKLSYIMLLAWYLRYRDNFRRLLGMVVPFAMTVLPIGLILAEPDLGTSLLFFPVLLFMLFMAGAKLRHLLGILAFAVVVVLLPVPVRITADMSAAEVGSRKYLAYWTGQWRDGEYVVAPAPLAKMKTHQIQRIEGWARQAEDDPKLKLQLRLGKGYQQYHSKMILGSGGLTGGMDLAGRNTYLRMLPEDHTDFIFSVIGGQWGFAGCMAILFLYGVIFVFGMEIATITGDPFGRLLVVGVLALTFSQVFIHVGMAMGLLPITGMTLPLVSYGGSSLVVNCAAIGLLVNVGMRRPIVLGRRPFEFGRKRERLGTGGLPEGRVGR